MAVMTTEDRCLRRVARHELYFCVYWYQYCMEGSGAGGEGARLAPARRGIRVDPLDPLRHSF